MRLEAQKNKLENLLTNNLNRRKDELVQALQEISVEDRKRTLENSQAELKDLTERIESTGKHFVGLIDSYTFCFIINTYLGTSRRAYRIAPCCKRDQGSLCHRSTKELNGTYTKL